MVKSCKNCQKKRDKKLKKTGKNCTYSTGNTTAKHNTGYRNPDPLNCLKLSSLNAIKAKTSYRNPKTSNKRLNRLFRGY